MLCRMSASTASRNGLGSATSSGPPRIGGGWQLGGVKLIGTQALPGLTHEYKGKRLPVREGYFSISCEVRQYFS